ncbi:MAG: hypothetical protein ACI8RT_001057, partial [Candidatus Azotimanducaceae bacterium]
MGCPEMFVVNRVLRTRHKDDVWRYVPQTFNL